MKMRNKARFNASASLRSLTLAVALTTLVAAGASAQTQPFTGKITVERKDATPAWPKPAQAPANAPNVLLILLDDVGFGTADSYGGPIPTPSLDHLTAQGLRFDNFHTAGICSPTRAALLTGRNHHRVGFGTVNGGESGYPGYNGEWKPEMASIAEILHLNGYSSAAFGKWHNTPLWETSPVGPFDHWPTSLGFDYFYGFMGGEASQWQPFLYRNTLQVDPVKTTESGYNFNIDIADDAISWLHTQRSVAPDRPYFLYFAPGGTHAPHQVPKEWIATFRGKFDQGWDEMREQTFARQKTIGLVAADAVMSPRPDGLPAWSSLTNDQKRLFAHQMEVYAGYLAQTDHEVGRVIAAARAAPGGENTIVMYIVGDNGPSAEGGLEGSYTNIADAFAGGKTPPVADQLAHMEGLGSDLYDNHFAAAWAWSLAAPFPWVKQIASHMGGIQNPMVLSWPGHIKQPGLRTQFTHVNDVAPTLYDLIGVTPPPVVLGVQQASFDGISFAKTLGDPQAPSDHHIQYFETLGNRGIYKDGWFAGAKHADPWAILGRSEDFVHDPWELYNLNVDFTQAHNLAKANPAKLKEMENLFEAEARRNDVYPLGNGVAATRDAPAIYRGRKHFVFYPDTWPVPATAAPVLIGSHTVTADIDIPASGAEGVIVSDGGRYGGFSLYVKNGRLAYDNNAFGKFVTTITANVPLTPGPARVEFRYERTDPAPWGGGIGRLFVNGKEVGEGVLSHVGPPSFMDGFCIGQECETAPGKTYAPPYKFTGSIKIVRLDANDAAGSPLPADAAPIPVPGGD
jgi:arylsulfatase A-like enzyme